MVPGVDTPGYCCVAASRLSCKAVQKEPVRVDTSEKSLVDVDVDISGLFSASPKG
jgi:hypothetical protein